MSRNIPELHCRDMMTFVDLMMNIFVRGEIDSNVFSEPIKPTQTMIRIIANLIKISFVFKSEKKQFFLSFFLFFLLKL